jgi:hypothetical protein
MNDVRASVKNALRGHGPRALLLLAAALVAALLAPAIPRDQTVIFRLAENDVKSLSATFTRHGDDEPLGGVTLAFDGHAPRDVTHRVALPNGEYVLTIDVGRERASAAQTTMMRQVILQGGVTTVFVESRQP